MPTDTSLNRFLEAQETSYPTALAEIRSGRKRTHWMWYVFPQLQGLGLSETARHYAIHDLAEAEAYLSHPVLGPRLIEICQVLLQLESKDANLIFGNPDDLKLKSSMTLFAALGRNPLFQKVLDKFFRGASDNKTRQLLAG